MLGARSQGAEAPADANPVGWPMWITGWRRMVFPAVFLIYLGQTGAGVTDHSDGVASIVGYVAIGVFCLAYVAALPARWTDRDRRFWALYGLMALMFVVELPIAHEDAFVMCVFLAILAIATNARWVIPGCVATAFVALLLPPAIPSWHAPAQIGTFLSILLVSLSMWAFFSIIRANVALSEARAEVAGLAAENERNRIARDLHDLLGHSLTTITVKAALAKRLAESDPTRAAVEIGEVEELSRRALADVRAAVSGVRAPSLAGELATSRELLRAAGIDFSAPGSPEVVDADLHELFGWILREGITNVVRHSRATRCTVELGPRSISITNEGHMGFAGGPGNGLLGLAERVRQVGGTILSRPVAGDLWRLDCEMQPQPVAEQVEVGSA